MCVLQNLQSKRVKCKILNTKRLAADFAFLGKDGLKRWNYSGVNRRVTGNGSNVKELAAHPEMPSYIRIYFATRQALVELSN